MTLRGNVQRLTEPHMEMVGGTIVSSISLLARLELAVKPDLAGGAAASSAASRSPINAVAMSLWQDIDREAREHDHEMGRGGRGKLVDLLQGWARARLSTDWEDFLEHVTLDWCDRITGQLDPGKPYQPRQPCPACEARFCGEDRTPVLSVYYLGEDGNILPDGRDWVMTCGACTNTWSGEQIMALGEAWSSMSSSE